jgi:hypothetical protein
MFFFYTVLILAYLFMTSQAVSECSDNPLIQPTSEGYNLAKTDSKLSAWWQNVSQSSNSGFANELAKKSGFPAYKCGIGYAGSCIIPNCNGKYGILLLITVSQLTTTDYTEDDAWALQALVSFVNMNTFVGFINVSVAPHESIFCN